MQFSNLPYIAPPNSKSGGKFSFNIIFSLLRRKVAYRLSTFATKQTLIIPKRHVASYFDLTNHEREAMNVMLQYVKQKIDERYHPDGYNVGINVNEAAGQSIFHVHMHLISRYKGDVKNPKGGVRGVIPEKQQYPVQQESIVDNPHTESTKEKSYTVEEKRNQHGNAYIPWEESADKLLCKMYDEGYSVKMLAEIFERSKGAIVSRLKKNGKIKD